MAEGTIKGATIQLRRPLALRTGTKVSVRIELLAGNGTRKPTRQVKNLRKLGFFGMWKDRTDITHSGDWVHTEREKWHQRPTRPD